MSGLVELTLFCNDIKLLKENISKLNLSKYNERRNTLNVCTFDLSPIANLGAFHDSHYRIAMTLNYVKKIIHSKNFKLIDK